MIHILQCINYLFFSLISVYYLITNYTYLPYLLILLLILILSKLLNKGSRHLTLLILNASTSPNTIQRDLYSVTNNQYRE